MAQQYRELGSSGAASRQVANLNQGKFTPSESTSNYANFAKDLFDVGGNLSAKVRRDAAQEEKENKIQDDMDQKRDDEDLEESCCFFLNKNTFSSYSNH